MVRDPLVSEVHGLEHTVRSQHKRIAELEAEVARLNEENTAMVAHIRGFDEARMEGIRLGLEAAAKAVAEFRGGDILNLEEHIRALRPEDIAREAT